MKFVYGFGAWIFFVFLVRLLVQVNGDGILDTSCEKCDGRVFCAVSINRDKSKHKEGEVDSDCFDDPKHFALSMEPDRAEWEVQEEPILFRRQIEVINTTIEADQDGEEFSDAVFRFTYIVNFDKLSDYEEEGIEIDKSLECLRKAPVPERVQFGSYSGECDCNEEGENVLPNGQQCAPGLNPDCTLDEESDLEYCYVDSHNVKGCVRSTKEPPAMYIETLTVVKFGEEEEQVTSKRNKLQTYAKPYLSDYYYRKSLETLVTLWFNACRIEEDYEYYNPNKGKQSPAPRITKAPYIHPMHVLGPVGAVVTIFLSTLNLIFVCVNLNRIYQVEKGWAEKDRKLAEKEAKQAAAKKTAVTVPPTTKLIEKSTSSKSSKNSAKSSKKSAKNSTKSAKNSKKSTKERSIEANATSTKSMVKSKFVAKKTTEQKVSSKKTTGKIPPPKKTAEKMTNPKKGTKR